MEKKVGEIFEEKEFKEFKGRKLQCVEASDYADCTDCIFFNGEPCPPKVREKYPCHDFERTDRKDVLYTWIHL